MNSYTNEVLQVKRLLLFSRFFIATGLVAQFAFSNQALAGGPTCERLFKEEASSTSKTSLKFTPTSQKMVIENLAEALINKDVTDDWKPLIENKKLKVIKRESSALTKTVDGVEYEAYYVRYTPKNVDRSLPVIVLHHGFSKSSRYFHDMILLYNSLGYEVIAPDGANIGMTLKINGKLTAPVVLDDANAVREILKKEKVKNFVPVGHSRGGAVMALVAAMPEFKDRIVQNFPLNSYTNWLTDLCFDLGIRFTPLGQANAVIENFRTLTMPAFVRNTFPSPIGQALGYVNHLMNDASVGQMRTMIRDSLGERDPHEIIDGLTIEEETDGVIEIAKGLANETSGRGFSTYSLYNAIEPFKNESSRQPLSQKNGEIKEEIPHEVRARTTFVFGGNDKMIQSFTYDPIFNANPEIGKKLVLLGTHYMPVTMPYLLVQFFDQKIREALGK